MSVYPERAAERDRWILLRRGPRRPVDASRPYAALLEAEPDERGQPVPIATLFLTNRECPWRCLMCDLWQNTLETTVPAGAIPAQIDAGLGQLEADAGEPPRWIKLYNSGSFFDPSAIPEQDYPAIAARAKLFERVIVESHPALAGERLLRFRDLLHDASLEVAMGLETAHPATLAKLNKRVTLERFAEAAAFLKAEGVALRSFVLVKPPFQDEAEGLHWAKESAAFAFSCGARVVSLIPTRAGNGALEELARTREFAPPRLATLEAAFDHGLRLGQGIVFADIWDLKIFSECSACFPAREARLARMNLSQRAEPSVRCDRCGAGKGEITA